MGCATSKERGATPPLAGVSPQSSSPANGKASDGEEAVATLRSDTAKGNLTEARLSAAATTAAPSQNHDPAAPAEASKASFSTSSQPGSPSADGGSGLPGRPAAAKPPRSRRGSCGQVSLDSLQEPSAGSAGSRPQLEQVSDSAGSDKLRPLKKMFLPADGTSPQPQQQAAPPAPSSETADAPPSPPAELAHVLSLLSRLLSASAVLVDLHDPPVAYIRDQAGLRAGDAREVRGMDGYQEVELLRRGGRLLGMLGAATPGAGSMPNPMLSQMANVVVREVEMMQAKASMKRASFNAEQQDVCSSGEWRPPPTPPVAIVDAHDAAWPALVAEDAIEAVTGTSAADWKGASLWDLLLAPFGVHSAAWNAVNEVTAAAGDLIVTGVGCSADPVRGPLVLRCTPANAALLAAQARPEAWADLLATLEQNPPDGSAAPRAAEAAEADAAVIAAAAEAFAKGKGAAAAQQQRQSAPYLVTVAKEKPHVVPRAAAADTRFASSGSFGQRGGGSGGPMGEEGGAPIEGVQLGPLLGKGSFGRVYHGYWHGSEVAIKVCNQGIARSGERTVKPWAGVEAVGSLGLHHRHVMRTLNHTTVVVPAPPPRSSSVRHASFHIPELGGPMGHMPNLDLGQQRPPPPMVRSASSDLDGSVNTSHGTQPGRLQLASLRQTSGAAPDVASAKDSFTSATGNPSPFAAAVAASGGSSSAAAPTFSPFADALREQAAAKEGAGGGSSGSGSGSGGNTPPGALRPPPLGGGSGLPGHLRGTSLGGGGSPGQLGGGGSGSSMRRNTVGAEQAAEVDTWVVMEYCNRGTLQRALEDGLFTIEGEEDGGRWRPDMLAVLTAGRQLAAAMAYMHARGVIHGDLSRANILLMDSEESPCGFDVKVADFGMARQLDAQSRIDTFSCGTITHTAPELMDEGHLSRAADVFAGGVLLWELLAGCGAWAGMNQAQIISAVLIHNRRPVFPPEAPRDYAELSMQCMATNPKQRPTFAEVERRIEEMLRELH